MNDIRTVVLTNTNQLREVADRWDDLWLRSQVTLPTMRAETIIQWIEQFAARSRVRILVVEEEGRFIAGMPLVGRRIRGWLPVASLASTFEPRGDLLIDHNANVPAATQHLSAAVASLKWPLVWMDEVPLDSPSWQCLLSALENRKTRVNMQECQRSGITNTTIGWDDFRLSWSKNHRRHLQRGQKWLDKQGSCGTKILRNLAPDEVEPLLRRGFEVEDRCWKGAVGHSVLKTKGMFEYYCRQAIQLAAWNQLQLSFLELNGEPIAFEYGYVAKHTYYSVKIGYNEDFAKGSPGKILSEAVIEDLFHRVDCERIDYLGFVSSGIRQWITQTYPLARIVAAPDGILGAIAFAAYHQLGPIWRRLRGGAEYREGKAFCPTPPS